MNDPLVLCAAEQKDYDVFISRVHQRTGIDLNLYKSQQMHRRLTALLERAAVPTFTCYADILDKNADEMSTFLDRITINVSELFRNPERWMDLETEILPSMLKAGRPLRVWSAGCSFGAEPYSIAMLLHKLTPNQRHYLLATDIDERILSKAKLGLVMEGDIKNVRPEFKEKYLTPSGSGSQISQNIRSIVTFKKHNLLQDQFETNFDLICCRNVVIYFTDVAKNALYGRFWRALKPGGQLLVGGTERIFNYRALGFSSSRPFFYERQDT